MSINQKYNFKVKYEQFGNIVDENYYDLSEIKLIEKFEQCVLELKQIKKEPYTMLELGANQAYYSLLFSAILGNKNCINIMIEPQDQIHRGIENFKLNNYDGIFIKAAVANSYVMRNLITRVDLNVPVLSFNEILNKVELNSFDVLHCDIDGHEEKLILDEKDFFNLNKFKYIFLCTHSVDKHISCKKMLLDFGYDLIYEIDPSVSNYTPHIDGVGHDSLLIFKQF